ncbi:MAG: hypothetical protein ACK4M0_14205, partial [Phreatobacter sp.]
MTSHRRSLRQILRIATLQLGLGLAGLAPLAAQQPAAAPAQAPASVAQPVPAQPASPVSAQ